jgi:hypothetical protein
MLSHSKSTNTDLFSEQSSVHAVGAICMACRRIADIGVRLELADGRRNYDRYFCFRPGTAIPGSEFIAPKLARRCGAELRGSSTAAQGPAREG